jgi:hypothetical protein
MGRYHWARSGALGSALLLGPTLALGSAEPSGRGQAAPELVTDRPDFTESSVVVPRASLQLESGLTWERAGDGARTLGGPELLLRYGVGRRTELRLGLPGYFHVRGGGGPAAGFGDTYLGVKYQPGPTRPGLDLAIIPALSLPTGSRQLSSRAVDPEVKLTWARELAQAWSVSGMFAFFWPTEDGRRNFTWMPTVSLGHELGGRWEAFLEYAGELPRRGGNRHVLHHGYAYALSPTSQADLHLGIGLSPAAPDFFLGAGFAIRYR